MKAKFVDLAQNILDHEVVDANNIPCGQVDDLELEGDPGGDLRLVAILVVSRPAIDRLPRTFALLLRRVFATRTVKIPWKEVLVLSSKVKLNSTAEDLGLGIGDRKVGRWIARILGGK
jgi:hypothetical protein